MLSVALSIGAVSVPLNTVWHCIAPDLFLANGDSQLCDESDSSTRADLEKIDANAYVLGRNCASVKGATDINAVYEDITNLGCMPCRA